MYFRFYTSNLDARAIWIQILNYYVIFLVESSETCKFSRYLGKYANKDHPYNQPIKKKAIEIKKEPSLEIKKEPSNTGIDYLCYYSIMISSTQMDIDLWTIFSISVKEAEYH